MSKLQFFCYKDNSRWKNGGSLAGTLEKVGRDRLLPEQETLVAEDAPILSKYQLQIEKANERLRKAEKKLLKAKIALKEIKMFWDLG